MRTWKVIVASSVWDLITAQVLYIANHSVDNALDWEDRLRTAIFKLEDVTGYAVDETATSRSGSEIHKMVFEGTYLVHYSLNQMTGVVNVIGFRHGSRVPRRGEP